VACARRQNPANENVLLGAIFAFVGGAAFPRLAHRLRFVSRLGPRGLIVYVACRTFLNFAIFTWSRPVVERLFASQTKAREALRIELGREANREELIEFRVDSTRSGRSARGDRCRVEA